MTPPTVQFIPASGPTLIIHDAFSGSGSATGRTPDTVDNGQTWQTSGTWTVGSGYLTSWTNSGTHYCAIDTQTSSFTLEAISQGDDTGGTSDFRHGLYWHYDTSTGEFGRLILNDDANLVHQEHDGTTFTVNTGVDTFSPIANNTDITWSMVCTASSISWSISVGGSEVSAGSVTPSVSPSLAGFWQRYANTARCLDFKVYT
jgi:hypothetical protein